MSEPVVVQISDICLEDTLSRRWNVSNAVRDERQDSDGDWAGGFVTADPCPRQRANSDAHELHDVSSGCRLKRGRSHVSVGDSPVKGSLWGNRPISGQPRGLEVGLNEDSRSGCTGAGCAEEREYIELSDDDDCDDCTFTCELCRNFWPVVLACPMPTCHCQVCQLCMQMYAQVQIDGLTSCLEKMGDRRGEEREGRETSYDISDRIQCPCEGCGTDMPVLSCRFLAAESVAKWEEAATAALLRGDTETFVACPGCEVSIEKVPTEPPPGAVLSGVPELDRTAPFAELDDKGHVLSREAICHRAEHRYRCAMCSVDFCGSCKNVPYHLGFSCLDYKVRQEAARCRYCDTPLVPPAGPGGLASEQLSPQEWLARPVRELRKELGACQLDASWCLSKGDLWAVHTVAKAVCGDADCKRKCKGACTRPLDCGHLCGGVRGETVCLPCLEVSAEGQVAEGTGGGRDRWRGGRWRVVI